MNRYSYVRILHVRSNGDAVYRHPRFKISGAGQSPPVLYIWPEMYQRRNLTVPRGVRIR